MSNKINVAELFAGVGGFRVGLEKASKRFDTIYMNQWEPSTKKQHAFECYLDNFSPKKNHRYDNIDIGHVNKMLEKDRKYINGDINLVVGGFPCQDYSVATTKSKGLEGKKGVLWWEIKKFLINNNIPDYVLLENVDRLLQSPKIQRGRDFLIMLSVLNSIGYDVEWKIIDASLYGNPQRRKRVFIFANKRGSRIWENIDYLGKNNTVLTKRLNILKGEYKIKDISNITLQNISDNETMIFFNYGFMKSGVIQTHKTEVEFTGSKSSLEDILEKNVTQKFFLSIEQKERIFKLKDGGRIPRTSKEGHEYFYTQGKMSRYDNINGRPSRTMLTSEGTINRSTHIVKDRGEYRFLTPIETERLNGFKDNWTESIESKNKRYFMMGNSLVTNIVKEIGKSILFFENKTTKN